MDSLPMYNVIIQEKAEQDLEDMILYITETLKAPEASKRLYQKIRQEILRLQSMPQRCPLIDDPPYSQMGVRILPVENYMIFFTVAETTECVHVLRILYCRREWQKLL